MILIHVGFLGYEMGTSRMKNVLTSGVKNILTFAFVNPTFYFLGWWVYCLGGILWACALFAATTASIMSGAVIERIQTVGFVILAIVLGSLLGSLPPLVAGMRMVGWSLNLASLILARWALCTLLLAFLLWGF